MLEYYTAEIFEAFAFGAASIIGGGLLFESGKRYAKTAGSNLFKGKIEALPFLIGVVVFGYFLRGFGPVVEETVYSIPALARLGMMILGSMILFNNSVDNFKYSDPKSISVYSVGLFLILWPFM